MTSGDGPPQGFKWDPAPEESRNDSEPLLYGSPQQIVQGSVHSPMGGLNVLPQQGTQAQVALIISIVSLISGVFLGGLGFLLSPISLILANKALQITKASPGHPDHGIARAAQILSGIMVGLLVLSIVLLGLFVAMLLAFGF
ncbi:MAG TPA: hypothetical protein HA356_00040 [Candidatus Poseidoniaceae archaeon]|nr:MAG TPA: hypothetical protein D7H95_00045 [Candidatus Poseidoniales archaeon]HII10445.1 hypothetical protein [Candidatus Poseidoniaceae archaeon]|tara:strand:+ start:1559 stop:1984 length:426 start_codon:yes stop_codon:yes gene_type:complete